MKVNLSGQVAVVTWRSRGHRSSHCVRLAENGPRL
jgi:hypothetical protein